ncbi:MAG: ATP-binding protein, partial [Pseudonocardiaceae bacterium]
AVELDCTDLQLRRGRHGWQLGQIATRAEAYPLDERVAGQLMLALYRCGRQAEALEHFQQLRARLADELGIDPGPALHRLYEQILTTDPTLTEPRGPVSVGAPVSVPRQLPARTPHFVGRAAQLHQLTSLLDDTAPAGGGTVVISAIDGTAGIGKTALALHWAHEAADRFPDGQLYVNLRGFEPTNTPTHPADALRGFLDAFAIPPERIPGGLDAEAGLYRSLLADRRVLVILDNARDADQVRPLLPASPGCLVVVTSRNQLTGLLTQHGAHPLTLDVLTAQEARALLARHLGPDRISADPDAVTDLIDHCARLPLALAIVAARAGTHPGFTLRVLAKELTDEDTRLDALDTGETATSIRAVFSWSYHQLSPPAARLFRLLGLHPGPDITLPAATQLADLRTPQAREALSELTRAHLLTQHTPGRYTFHDLLRTYATHQATMQDPQEEQDAALTRLFDHYLHNAASAINALHPTDQQHRPDLPPPAATASPITDPATAQHWLDTERANLTAIIAHAAALGWHTYTIQLANTVLARYLNFGGPYRGGHYRDALAIYTHVRHAARHTEDRTAEALALTNLGLVCWRQGHYEQATDYYQQALTTCREIEFRAGEVQALSGLGLICWIQGHNQQATDYYQQALTTCRAVDHRAGEAWTLIAIGVSDWRYGHYQQAADHFQHALTISREIGDPATEVWALTGTGVVECSRGRYQQAIDYHERALTISRAVGDRANEAQVLTNLGRTYREQGHPQQALDHHQQALALVRGNGDRASEAQILNGLGEAHHDHGQPHEAHTQHTTALTLATEIGDCYEQARAHHGLAHTHHTTGDYDQARHHWHHALTLFTDLDVPDAEDVRAHLTALDQTS